MGGEDLRRAESTGVVGATLIRAAHRTHLTRSLLQILFARLVTLVAASHLSYEIGEASGGEVRKAVDAVDGEGSGEVQVERFK